MHGPKRRVEVGVVVRRLTRDQMVDCSRESLDDRR